MNVSKLQLTRESSILIIAKALEVATGKSNWGFASVSDRGTLIFEIGFTLNVVEIDRYDFRLSNLPDSQKMLYTQELYDLGYRDSE